MIEEDREDYMLKKIIDFIVVAIGVVSGILTIISFIWLILDVKIEKFNLVIDLNVFFANINIALFFVTMIIFLICIWILSNENKKRMKMRDDVLLHYNKILWIIQNGFLMRLEKGSDSYQKIVYEIICEIKLLFKVIYNKTIRIQIKMIQEGQGMEAYVQTICSTQEPLKPMQKVKENSYFFELFKTGKRYFSFSIKDKKNIYKYMSSNPNWKAEYASSLVLPIKKAHKSGTTDIVGFLCLDSLDIYAFTKDVNTLIVPLLDTITGYLYLILESKIKDIN